MQSAKCKIEVFILFFILKFAICNLHFAIVASIQA